MKNKLQQKYSSKKTSLNQISSVLKTIIKKKNLIDHDQPTSTSVLDYGGGKYEKGVKYMADHNCEMTVYDPYNRPESHNQMALQATYKYVVCGNVLNVIAEEAIRTSIVEHMVNLCSDKVFISVYEGDRSGIGKETTKGFQCNLKLSEYLKDIKKSFPQAFSQYGLIIIEKNK